MLLKMIQSNFGMLAFKQMLKDHVQGHCEQADSKYYYTNKQVTLTASYVCQELCYVYANSHLIFLTTTWDSSY